MGNSGHTIDGMLCATDMMNGMEMWEEDDYRNMPPSTFGKDMYNVQIEP